mgnify:CR=1 FL=1
MSRILLSSVAAVALLLTFPLWVTVNFLGHPDNAAIFTGYGVGMGVIINGEVFHGATGAAAEFEHGIAVYEGLIRRTVGKTEREYLNLRYAEGDRLYVPVDQIDRVSRYIGAGDAEPAARAAPCGWRSTRRASS